MKKFFSFLTIAVAFAFIGCKQDPIHTKTSQTNLIKPGDIVVVNGTSRSLLLLDSDGNYKSVIFDLGNNSETLYDVAFKKDTKEIIFTINGAARVGAISVVDGSYRTLIADANLSGALKGITVLNNGDILVAEVNNVERFAPDGTRRTLVSGVTWPNTLGAMTTIEQLYATADGGFIACASGSDNVKRFTNNAVLVGNAQVSGIAGTTDAFGCIELADGRIAMAFNGTTDTIKVVAGTMPATNTALYSDLAYLASPRTLSQALNGNILAVDSAFNQIVEITSAGAYVRTLGGTLLGTPNAVFSVPNY